MKQAINTFFDQVVVINLKSRPDRLAEMREQLRCIGLRTDSSRVGILQTTKPTDAAGFPSLGARGCFLSHLAVLREARDRHVRSVLILEDDLNFCENFPSRFEAVAGFLDKEGWGMLYGSYVLDAPPAHSHLPCLPARPASAVGTSAFLAIHGDHLDALVSYLEAMLRRPPGNPQGGPMHIDGAYCWFRQFHPEVITWLASPMLGYQRSSRTDVHHLRWFDRRPGLAGVIASMRRWRNRWRP